MQKWAGTRFVMWDGSAREIGMKKVVAESVPDKARELSGELGWICGEFLRIAEMAN